MWYLKGRFTQNTKSLALQSTPTHPRGGAGGWLMGVQPWMFKVFKIPSTLFHFPSFSRLHRQIRGAKPLLQVTYHHLERAWSWPHAVLLFFWEWGSHLVRITLCYLCLLWGPSNGFQTINHDNDIQLYKLAAQGWITDPVMMFQVCESAAVTLGLVTLAVSWWGDQGGLKEEKSWRYIASYHWGATHV